MEVYTIVKLKELHEKNIKDILDKKQVWNLPLVEKDANIQEVLSILTASDHVWVVEEKGKRKICGVITESDVLYLLAPPRVPRYTFGKRHSISLLYKTARKAKDIMCKRVARCSLDDKVGDTLTKMVNSGLRRLPIVENDEIIGEITVHYILQKLLGKI